MKLNFDCQLSAHCESGATSNILRYYKIDINEPLAFGIGSGLYFGHIPFLKMNYIPVSTYRALPGLVFTRACKNLGIDYFRSSYRNPDKSMDELDKVLDSGHPVGLQVGVYQLPFFPPEYRMHYNMHNMVIYGREGNQYWVADSVIPGDIQISREDLKRVRYPKGTFKPNGRMYYVKNIPENLDMQKGILKGLRKTVYEMTEIPFPLVGCKGIKYLSKKLRKWPETVGEKMASRFLGQLILLQEEFGTGGCGYRYIFGAFLSDAAKLMNDDKFTDFAKQTSELAAKWREFSYQGARNCKERSGAEVTYDALADMLLDISDSEKKLYKDIKYYLRNQYKVK